MISVIRFITSRKNKTLRVTSPIIKDETTISDEYILLGDYIAVNSEFTSDSLNFNVYQNDYYSEYFSSKMNIYYQQKSQKSWTTA